MGHAPSFGDDLLDGGIGRLHTIFRSQLLSVKKVLIFLANLDISSLY